MNSRSLVAIALLALLIPAAARAGASDKRLDVYWNDTEGGAATLIVTPVGESVLIDTGNPGGRDAQRIYKTAQTAGLKQIDYLIVTHFHIDHFGGAAELSKLIPIKVVYDNGEFPGSRERPSKDYLQFPAERRVLSPGDTLPLKQLDGAPPVFLKCIAARQKFIDPPADANPNPDCEHVRKKLDDGSDNANSIVSLLGFGDFRLFVGGDLTWNVEAKLVCPINLVGKVDVYQVTHHGLDQSNNPVIIKSLSPTVAVFSNGPRKGAEPGTWETVKSAESIQGIYFIHKSLSPKGPTAPDEFFANLKTGQDDEGNCIKLSTDPMAKAYTAGIPANGHERTFQTTPK
jgi:beta-lactamase superfamily II metal-dependent hydrolase